MTPHWNPLHPHSRASTTAKLTACASRCASRTLRVTRAGTGHPPSGITVNNIHNIVATTLAHPSKRVQTLMELDDKTSPIQHFTMSNDKRGCMPAFQVHLKCKGTRTTT